MIKFGKAVVKLRIPILILSIFLLIPSAIGYFNTRVNYDILTYLPEEIETMKGQDLLLDEFGTGAFSFCVVEGMDAKDISAMREQMEEVPHVKSVIWYDSLADISIPMEMLPDEIYDFFNNDEKDSTLLAVLYDTSMSADETMDAIEELRGVVKDQCYISGTASLPKSWNETMPTSTRKFRHKTSRLHGNWAAKAILPSSPVRMDGTTHSTTAIIL